MKKKILLKLSGKLVSETVFHELIHDIKQLRHNYSIVLVHGGGKSITEQLEAQNIQSVFKNGLRVTPAAAVRVVEMVLTGNINKQLVRWMNAAALPALGISGSDTNLIQARQIDPSYGYVGQIEKINPEIVRFLWQNDYIVVVAPTGTSPKAECLNINADITAGSLATALGVEHLIFFTDTEGVMLDGKKMENMTVDQIREFIETGVAKDGMIPKLKAGQSAKERGNMKVKIGPWNGPGSLLHILAGASIGTEII